MKVITLLTVLALTPMTFAGATKAKTLRKPIQLANQLQRDLPTMHEWSSRCTTETYVAKLNCSIEDTGGKFDSISCTAVGLFGDVVEVPDAGKLVVALRNSGLNFKSTLELTQLSCVSEYAGFANCGSDKESTFCSVQTVKSK